MKKRVNFISEVLVVFFLTLMVVIDFFPNIGIDMSIGVIGVVSFIILVLLLIKKGNQYLNQGKKNLLLQFF